MSSVLKNSFYVFILAGLFALPSVGFGFAQYKQPESRAVLGIADQRVAVQPTKSKELNSIEIVDQLEFKVGLNSDAQQKFFDVVPSEYLNGEYSFIVVAPKDLLDRDVEFNLITNDKTADMQVMLPKGFKPKGALTYPVTILVVR